MPIYQDSRYEGAPVVPVQGSDGVWRATLQPPLGEITIGSYNTHRVVSGESLVSLAFDAYGDPEFWWRLADANPQLEYPDELTPGQLLRIPSFAEEVDF